MLPGTERSSAKVNVRMTPSQESTAQRFTYFCWDLQAAHDRPTPLLSVYFRDCKHKTHCLGLPHSWRTANQHSVVCDEEGRVLLS